jgi:hypothetical protein
MGCLVTVVHKALRLCSLQACLLPDSAGQKNSNGEGGLTFQVSGQVERYMDTISKRVRSHLGKTNSKVIGSEVSCPPPDSLHANLLSSKYGYRKM